MVALLLSGDASTTVLGCGGAPPEVLIPDMLHAPDTRALVEMLQAARRAQLMRAVIAGDPAAAGEALAAGVHAAWPWARASGGCSSSAAGGAADVVGLGPGARCGHGRAPARRAPA